MKLPTFLILSFAAATAAAQEAPTPSSVPLTQASQPAGTPQPLPPGPLLKPIPDAYQWTVVQKGVPRNPATAKPEPGKPDYSSTVIGQKVGEVVHVMSTAGNGNQTEVWQKSGYQFIMNPGWKKPAVTTAPVEQGFKELAWVSAKNFTEIKKVAGHGDCMYFKDNILPSGYADLSAADKALITREGTDIEASRIPVTACIEVERRLPVEAQIGEEKTTYKFEPLQPGAVLTLPADLQTALAAQRSAQQANYRKSVRP